MNKQLLGSLVLFVILALTPVPVALAHGGPEITAEPDVVPAGGEIVIIGGEMEAGELFVITLEGVTESILLGEVAVIEKDGEGGFEVTFTIPAGAPPGSYTVRAATDEETALVEIAVTAPKIEASDEPAIVQEASGEPHELGRSKPAGQIIGVIIAALASLGLGVWLIRRW